MVALACRQAPRHDSTRETERAPASEPAPASQTTRRPAAITPEIVAKAEEILDAHSQEPMGTEFPFELGGKKYVARIEQHDNPDGDPDRPTGPHKGITVYVLE
jgi:hypothetical protein